MEFTTPINMRREQSHTERRAKALATIEALQPISFWTQKIILVFCCSILGIVLFYSTINPASNYMPFALLLLLPIISVVVHGAITTQRRLNALIEIVKLDLKIF
ncbi:MAG: hypothetical protein QFF03_21265 [Pseudomonadota bacterium]|nr:hypothetical protein [Pseudomonadota bacterium]